jgi:hypothetical protein
LLIKGFGSTTPIGKATLKAFGFGAKDLEIRALDLGGRIRAHRRHPLLGPTDDVALEIEQLCIHIDPVQRISRIRSAFVFSREQAVPVDTFKRCCCRLVLPSTGTVFAVARSLGHDSEAPLAFQ